MTLFYHCLKFLLISQMLFAVSSALSPYRWFWIDSVALLVIYCVIRFHGLERVVYVVLVMVTLEFGMGAPALLWSKVLILLGMTVLLKHVFDRLYIDSYLLESSFSGIVIVASGLLHSAYLYVAHSLTLWNWPFFLRQLSHAGASALISFLLFILLDIYFRHPESSDSAWARPGSHH